MVPVFTLCFLLRHKGIVLTEIKVKESWPNFQISFSFNKWGWMWLFDENMKKIVFPSIDFITSDTVPDNLVRSSLQQLFFIHWQYCISPCRSFSKVVGPVLFPQQQLASTITWLKHAFLALYITSSILQKICGRSQLFYCIH